ncbi:hypothetical protein [Listeria rocourtiae]|uniref:hypothetical protein n=1 Tax=Listeria rocourtiae TaxID=647910 RepID=UPI003D2F57AE
MIIKSKQIIERIGVFHNSEEELNSNIENLMKDGYSGNIRLDDAAYKRSATAFLDVANEDESALLDRYPGLKIHHYLKSRFSDSPFRYVLYTEHEKIIEGREN